MTREEEKKILSYIEKQEADRRREALREMVNDIREKHPDNRIIMPATTPATK